MRALLDVNLINCCILNLVNVIILTNISLYLIINVFDVCIYILRFCEVGLLAPCEVCKRFVLSICYIWKVIEIPKKIQK